MGTLTEHGGKVDDATAGFDIHAASAFRFVTTRDAFKLSGNEDVTREWERDNNPASFYGSKARLQEMAQGKINLAPFHDARRAISEVTREISAELADIAPKRVRRMSDQDGDWDHARMWELAPFQSTKRARGGIARVIDVEVNFQFNAGTKTHDIERFGAFAYSVVQAIESAGVQVNLTCGGMAQNVFARNEVLTKQTCRVKQAGEYMEESLLARCFTTEFFRRVMFTLSVAACDSLDKTIRSTLGKAVRVESSATHGKLVLAPDSTQNFDAAKFMGFIKTALGITASAAPAPLPEAPRDTSPDYPGPDYPEAPQAPIAPQAPKAPRAKPIAFPPELSQYKKGDAARVAYGPESGKSGTIFWAGFSQKGTPRVGVRIDGRNVFLNAKQIEVAI